MSDTTTPSVAAFWRRRLLASRFGLYPTSATAESTFSRDSGRTVEAPFNTRDTVAGDTPALTATSLIFTSPLSRNRLRNRFLTR